MRSGCACDQTSRVGTCLSGGLDSSLISALAGDLYNHSGGEEFLGIHAKSIERATDESDYARRVAERAGIRLVTVEPTSDDFANTIDEVVYTQEEPLEARRCSWAGTCSASRSAKDAA